MASVADLDPVLARAARARRARTAALLAPLGLHPGQEQVLGLLWKRDGRTPTELARSLDVEPATVTKALRRLEAGGFLVRLPSAADRRGVEVWLTEAGRSVRPAVRRVQAVLRRDVADRLTARQVDQLGNLLGRLVDDEG